MVLEKTRATIRTRLELRQGATCDFVPRRKCTPAVRVHAAVDLEIQQTPQSKLRYYRAWGWFGRKFHLPRR